MKAKEERPRSVCGTLVPSLVLRMAAHSASWLHELVSSGISGVLCIVIFLSVCVCLCVHMRVRHRCGLLS